VPCFGEDAPAFGVGVFFFVVVAVWRLGGEG
jgi:hypothetical protein